MSGVRQVCSSPEEEDDDINNEYLNFKKPSIGDRVSCQQLGLEGSLCGLVDWFTSPMTFSVMGRWTDQGFALS